jgi:hypothetical protein
MIELPVLFASAVAIAASLGSIAIWAPRRVVVKSVALGIFTLFLPVGFAGWSDLLSRPKPAQYEWLQGQADEAQVLAGSIEEGKGVYLWLRLPQSREPRAYAFPWDEQAARQLQEAMQEAERSGGGVRMRRPFDHSLDPREPKFYADPVPALPPKGGQELPPALRFEEPGQAA